MMVLQKFGGFSPKILSHLGREDFHKNMNEFLWKTKLAVFLGLTDIHAWELVSLFIVWVWEMYWGSGIVSFCVWSLWETLRVVVFVNVLDCFHGLVKSGCNLYFW